MVDIPHELILKAADEINKKQGVCDILPAARFSMTDGTNEFRYDTLVCDKRMGVKQTGTCAHLCKNCALEKKAADLRGTKKAKPNQNNVSPKQRKCFKEV
jgi:hypothetical protein